jgi:hypothetical protein
VNQLFQGIASLIPLLPHSQAVGYVAIDHRYEQNNNQG